MTSFAATTLQRILNRHVRASATAPAMVRELEGRTLALKLAEIPVRFHLRAADGELSVEAADPDDETAPDASIETSLPGLITLAGSEARDAVAAGRLRIRGDAVIAQGFARLLKAAAPDLEAELAGVVGDGPAFHLARAARGAMGWARRATDTLARDLGEYLQEERRDLVGPWEVEDFLEQVDELREETDRLDARLRRLQRRLQRTTEGGER